MSNLDNLIARILADGESKAKTLIENAENEARQMLKKAEAEANADGTKLIAAAGDEAQKIKDLTVSAKKIEIRDMILSAKQETIDRALAAVKARLSAMPMADYEAFLRRCLSALSLSEGETLIVPEAYKNIDMAALNAHLAAAGQPTLTLDKTRQVADGFKLVKDDIENDNSFDALIDYYRSSLEQTVMQTLY